MLAHGFAVLEAAQTPTKAAAQAEFHPSFLPRKPLVNCCVRPKPAAITNPCNYKKNKRKRILFIYCLIKERGEKDVILTPELTTLKPTSFGRKTTKKKEE